MCDTPYGFCEMVSFQKPGIAYGKPPIVIADKNDFKIDTFIGNITCAHRTNVLYVQPELHEVERNDDSTTAQNITKKEVSEELDVKCKILTNGQQYVFPKGAGTEPPVREKLLIQRKSNNCKELNQ